MCSMNSRYKRLEEYCTVTVPKLIHNLLAMTVTSADFERSAVDTLKRALQSLNTNVDCHYKRKCDELSDKALKAFDNGKKKLDERRFDDQYSYRGNEANATMFQSNNISA